MNRVAGKVAIVTGAGSRDATAIGTGRAISLLLAREGAKVCLVDIDEGRARETANAIDADGGECVVLRGDVGSEEDCRRAVGSAVEAFGKLDILVNNAALTSSDAGTRSSVENLDLGAWNRLFAVNLTGAMLMCKHALPELVAAGGGAIVNIASLAALLSDGSVPAYAAAKAGLVRLTSELAVSYGRANVRANVVAPGMIFTGRQSEATAEAAERRRKAAPLGLRGDAWDVAWAVLFLASDEARFVTAACLPVDGGASQTQPLAGWRLVAD